ncbi:AcrR family transcriptional regulator [Saccharothrix tamanrassetensis]|uniref:AcrR family transcriptional regulator n=1 Tax=Saccharothrix tamanrassetensis TaxID=1051531 RepID=A0A841CJG2_9PSEU|nr:TetR/AcrR family transcriptional regulator C-terminal domain-containing protein [Saccharothrix tamanrassetensis]MBB5957113.1 AcrR family transcriptional regulator [Saccharothrix tamanrassetensis]
MGESRGAELLWGSRGKTARPQRLALTVDRIADAAIEVADAEGMAAVSMQHVAAQLEVTKMALYRHVASKAELVAVMIESAVGEPPDLTTVPGGWRPRLVRWADLMRAAWDRHPWLPAATTGERLTGPREVGWTESAVAALADTGLDGSERMDAVFLLSGHIRNTQSAATAGTQPWTAEKHLRDILRDHSHRFPALLEAEGSTNGSARDNGWSFGLERILDGLAVLIDSRR